MLSLRQADLTGRRILQRQSRTQSSRGCPDCGAIDQWTWPSCGACGSGKSPLFVCDCGHLLDEEETFEYTASGVGTTKVVKRDVAAKCSNCGKYLVDLSYLHALDSFAMQLPADTELLPELGLATPKFIEVFATVEFPWESPAVNITVRHKGIRARIGDASRTFRNALGYITESDTSDFGHDLSSTLRVSPGPPYSDEQRRALHVILSRLRREVKAPISFWSLHFEEPSEEEEAPITELLELLEGWPEDNAREALALANAIASQDEPGAFINTFRLLELILGRLIDRDLESKRRDRSISSKDFLSLAKLHTTDLKTRLRHRILELSVPPTQSLESLWRVMSHERYSADGVYDRITKFRNRHVHQLVSGDPLVLPWELPNYRLFARHLLALLVHILKN